MGRIILSIVLLVILAVIVALNATYTTNFNLFGYKAEGVSIVAVGLAAFVLGVIYSFLLYFISFLNKRSKDRLKQRQKEVRHKESQLDQREEAVEDAGGAAQERPAGTEASPKSGGGLFSGRKKKKKT